MTEPSLARGPDRRPGSLDVPPGSGLGSSSTLIVAMLKAYVEWLDLALDEYQLADLAFQIERVDLGLSGGKQDQFAAAFGGFNWMEFGPGERCVINPLRVKNWIRCELESSLVLFYSGVSRQSATIIDEQIARIEAGHQPSIDGLLGIREAAVQMKESVLRGRIREFAAALGHSWEAKKSTASSISNPHLDEIHRSAQEAGALAGKVSGAGGGGFMMFLIDPARRHELIRALAPHEGSVVQCHFSERGAEGWKLFEASG